MKRLLILLLVLALLLAACDPVETVTPTEEEPTSTATASPSPSATATATATITMTPTATSTPAGEPNPANLLKNPGFEGRYRPVIFGEVNVAPDWEPFYCDEPYMDEKCPALRQGDGNPFELMMGRPEFKPIDRVNYPELVWNGDLAQTWFCFWRTCNAGVFQTFATVAGEQYEVGAMVRSWFNYDDDIPSDLETEDDWAGSVWWIGIDTSGNKKAFDESLTICRFESTPDSPEGKNFYDNWVHIYCSFEAQGDVATVYFGNLRTWPIANNDNYIGEAYAYQLTGVAEDNEPTPTPIATASPAATPEIVLDPSAQILAGYYFPYGGMNTRDEPAITGELVGGLTAGVRTEVYAEQDGWLCIDKNWSLTSGDQYEELVCNKWVAYQVNGYTYGLLNAVDVEY